MNTPASNKVLFSLIELIVLGSVVGAFVHYVYFLLAPLIWAQNQPIPIASFTPWTRFYATERDGIEVYSLYTSVFAESVLLLCLSNAYAKIGRMNWRIGLGIILLLGSSSYFASLGFHPPMSSFEERSWHAIGQQFLSILPGLAAVLLCFYLARNNIKFTLLISAVILLPVCFISTGPAHLPDYVYILAPALRILDGTNFSEIYLQYDLFLSLIAASILFFRQDPDLLQILGQASFYFLFLGIFLFSRRLFFDKCLSVFLLLALILVRIYGGSFHALASLQVTPLRLDLWFLILVAVYFKGPHHWLPCVILSALIVLHRNFGIIYFAAYCQLLATLAFFDYIERRKQQERESSLLRNVIAAHIHTNRNNLLMLAFAFLFSLNILGNNDAYRYQKIGIGFIPISSISFYWYLAILITITMVLLFKLRRHLPQNYLVSGVFLVYLAIGNSVYFFGRSHENNLINISIIFVFLSFLLVDILQGYLVLVNANRITLYRKIAATWSVCLITLISITYGDNIKDKAAVQIDNLSKMQFIFPHHYSKAEMESSIANIKTIIGNSAKVYFISDYDFFYYYYGNYKPIGYYNPFTSWMFVNDMTQFVNKLLDEGYYIVVDKPDLISESMPTLKYSIIKGNSKHVIFWRELTPSQ